MIQKLNPTILIIIGISGDLSRRYLLPAIEKIVQADAQPDQFKIIGISRQNITTEELLADIKSDNSHNYLSKHLTIMQMDPAASNDYGKLVQYIKTIEKDFGISAQKLFYLSVPPAVSLPIVEQLGKSGLAGDPTSKLLLEKPFGTDLASAKNLVERIAEHFTENQVYRIDHYLAKEMSQNFVVFRDANYLFSNTWNKNYIEKIEVVASEKIGIEGRVSFYENVGAMRDIAESHLLQLAALVLMENPDIQNLAAVPAQRLKALQQLYIPDGPQLSSHVWRGQYQEYRDEVNNHTSTVETALWLRLSSNDPLWINVPIEIRTGKSLSEKMTQIRITYKKDAAHESNQLIINIQPQEGVELQLWSKVPGYERNIEKHSLSLSFREHYDIMPEAYEQVFLDAINSNHTLFVTSKEVLETWRILEPIQKAWKNSSDDLTIYKSGTPIMELGQ